MLFTLQEKEEKLTKDIDDIDSKITDVVNDFQPRIDQIENEKTDTKNEEVRLKKEMVCIMMELLLTK